MLLAALSLWTAIPLGWIYIGSKVSHTQFPSQGPYFVVAVGIVISVAPRRLADRPPQPPLHADHRHQPAGADAPHLAEEHARHLAPAPARTTVVEAVLMGSVLLAGAALTVWFFLLAGSPIPNQ